MFVLPQAVVHSNFSQRYARGGPTIHSFTHSLASILVYLRDGLVLAPSFQSDSLIAPTSMLGRYARFEGILVALSAFCNRVRCFDRLPFSCPNELTI